MIDPEILQDYISEARELLEEMDMNLLGLEKQGAAPELLNNIFRVAHSIKGAAQYIGLEKTSALTHGVETLLDQLREGMIQLNPDIIEFLFRVKDCLTGLTQEVESHQEELSEVAHLLDYSEALMSADQAPLPESLYEEAEEVSFELGTEEEMLTPDRVAEVQAEEARTLAAIDEDEVDDGTALMTIGVDDGLLSSDDTIMETFPGESTVDLEGFPSESTVEIIGDPAVQLLYTPGSEFERPTQILTFEAESVHGVGPQEGTEGSPTPSAESSLDTSITGQLDAGTTLPATVAHLLNLSLYLDDLEDEVNVEEGLSSIMETVGKLVRSMEYLQLSQPAQILRSIQNKAYSLSPSIEPIIKEDIQDLRGLLTSLRPYYPEDLFPWKDSRVPAEAPGSGEASLYNELEKVPGFELDAYEAIRDAGFSSMKEISDVDMDTLLSIPGLSHSFAEALFESVGVFHLRHPSPKVHEFKEEKRSLLADVDDDLLNGFDSPHGEISLSPDDVEETGRLGSLPTGGAEDLLSELGTIVADTDRELMEIFLAYGWEILDKVGPILDRMKKTGPKGEDFQECAENIKAIRASSTYMDLQKLANFLDEWYERTVWTAERVDTAGPTNMDFMGESFDKFQAFLNGMELLLKPEFRQQPEPSPRPREITTQPKSTKPAAARPASPRPAAPAPGPSQRPAAPKPAVTVSPKPSEPAPGPAPTEAGRIVEPPRAAESRIETRPARPEPRSEPRSAAPENHWGPLSAPRSDPEDAQDEFVAMTRDTTQEAPVVRTMRVDAAKVDQLLNQVGELVVNRSFVEQLAMQLKLFQRTLKSKHTVGRAELQTAKGLALKVTEASLTLSRVVEEIQEGVMKLRMLPVGQLFNRMPRLIRDLSRRVGKSVDLRVSGADTEVDKRVIEQVYNPLVHLIRNAVDHGIEDTETRKRAGKKENGTISLSAYSLGNYVVIDVEDDGQGIDTQAVLDRALENHLVEAADAATLSTDDIHDFIFRPGFSTSRKVTRTSGRGVGMDVVRKDVEKINGHVEIQSERDLGTKISIKIPLTLAIIQTLLIKSGKHAFAIPLTSVREIIQIDQHEIRTIEGFEVVKFREETIPIIRVDQVFNLGSTSTEHPRFLVLTTSGQKTVGFLVEKLLGEQDVVIKPLAEHVCEVRGLAGSTILGDGTIALVMDIAELVDGILSQQRDLGMPASGFLVSQGAYATKRLPM